MNNFASKTGLQLYTYHINIPKICKHCYNWKYTFNLDSEYYVEEMKIYA